MPTEYHSSAERPASLEEETKTTNEEARMVLPGIQALFGFHRSSSFGRVFEAAALAKIQPDRITNFMALEPL
jgi:hypothetical protein